MRPKLTKNKNKRKAEVIKKEKKDINKKMLKVYTWNKRSQYTEYQDYIR